MTNINILIFTAIGICLIFIARSKWLDNIILKKADKLKKERQESYENRQQEWKQAQVKIEENTKKLKAIFETVVNEAVEYLTANVPCPHKVGDHMVLNIYDLKYKGANSWDGGPHGLQTCVNNKHGNDAPLITGVCTEVRVSTALLRERIDSYIYNEMSSNIAEAVANPADAIEKLYLHLLRYPNNFDLQHMGVYYDVFFKTNTDFQPQWGLNAASWLPVDSQEAKETVEVWEQEIEIQRSYAKVKQQVKEIEAKKREIDEKYRGIKIISGRFD